MPIVCIAGMHRSGTSMIAQLLQLCGLYLGDENNLMPATEFNSEGYFEHPGFVETNDALLSYVDASWHLPQAQAPNFDLQELPASITERARELIAELDDHILWGWKDPRNSLTLSFWRQLIPELKIILCLRNPVEVTQSLGRRDGFPPLKCYELWQTYNESLMRDSPGKDLLVTHYATYFRNPQQELQRLLDFIAAPVSTVIIERACAASQPTLQHNRSALIDLMTAGAPLPVTHLYAELCLQAGSVYLGALNSDVSESLDNEQGEKAISEYRLLMSVLERHPFVEAVALELSEKERQAEKLRLQVAEQDEQIEELRSALATIYSGNSWKLTQPMRDIKALLDRSLAAVRGSRNLMP